MSQIALTDAEAALIAKGSEFSGQFATLRAVGGDAYLGDASVTVETGVLIQPADGLVTIALDDGDAVHGIAAAGASPVIQTLVL